MAGEKLTWTEANRRYQLEQYLTHYHEDQQVVVHEAGEVLEGDLGLDAGEAHFVPGDLEVKGNVLARGDECGFLVVLGTCRAKNLISGGPDIYIHRDLIVSNGVVADYNHGVLTVGGSLSARTVAAEHETIVRGTIRAKETIDFGGFRVDDPAFKADISHQQATREARKVFVPEVLNSQGYVTGSALIDRVLDGEPLLLSST